MTLCYNEDLSELAVTVHCCKVCPQCKVCTRETTTLVKFLGTYGVVSSYVGVVIAVLFCRD